MSTDDVDEYFIYENRLASFHGPQRVTKRRASTAATSRAPKTLSWPHKSIKPADVRPPVPLCFQFVFLRRVLNNVYCLQMAKAGFIFQPLPSNPDNVACFLCNKSLDGWEEDDRPLEEHLKHSPECGWAITAAVEAELGDYAREDPRDVLMSEARKATFAGRWPHENKKGWSCKTKQVRRRSNVLYCWKICADALNSLSRLAGNTRRPWSQMTMLLARIATWGLTDGRRAISLGMDMSQLPGHI